MGLLKKRKPRATRKAEAKALRHKAGVEAKLSARNERKRDKQAAKEMSVFARRIEEALKRER
mgnify:CR=1 FL=1